MDLAAVALAVSTANGIVTLALKLVTITDRRRLRGRRRSNGTPASDEGGP